MPRTSIAGVPSPGALVATPYRRSVLVLALLTLCWRAWTVSRWTWQDDDYLFMHEAVTMPLWEYIMQDHNSHVMPGGFLVTRLMVAAAPFDFVPAIVIVAIVSAANVLLWGVALARVTRNHVAALLPLAVIALSPVLMEPMMWWAVAVNALPLQLCLASAVIFAVRYAETQRNRDLLWMGLLFILGLLFWQKCVFSAMPLAFVLVATAHGSFVARVQRVWRALTVLAVISAPYLAIYLYLTRGVSNAGNSVETSFGGHTTTSVLSDYGRAFEQVFLPSLFGGPWGSLRVSSDPFTSQRSVLSILVILVAAVAVAWIATRHWRALWLLALPILYSVVTLGLVLFSSRDENLWDVMVTERYHVDGVVIAMLTWALLIRETSGNSATISARQFRAVGAAALVLALSLCASNILQAQRMGRSPAITWVSTVRSDIVEKFEGRRDDEPLVLVDKFAPDRVLPWAYWAEKSRLSYILAPLGHRIAFDQAGDQLWSVTDEGQLEPMVVIPSVSAEPGPVEGCGYVVEPGDRVEIALTGGLFSWEWGVQIATFSAGPADLMLELGDEQIPVPMPAGPQLRAAQYEGVVPDHILVSSAPGSESTVCVTDLIAGPIGPKT